MFQEETTPFPVLKMTGEDILHPEKVDIVADGCSLLRDDGSCDCTFGVLLIMAVYWIYGYPIALRKTFSFLEHLIFNLKSTKTISVPAFRLHTDLTHTTC